MAFSKFRDSLTEQVKLSNGDETFLGKIIYSFKGKVLTETLNVKLSLTTIEYGRISIDDGDILNSDIVHMGFNPDFQEYSYDNTGFLIIDGKSTKAGNYTVKITQV
jgi:hypothetical protein